VGNRAIQAIAITTFLLAGCTTASGRGGASGASAAPAPTGRGSPADWARLEPLAPITAALLFHRNSDVPFPEVELASTLPGVCRVTEADARKEALDGAWDRLREIDQQAAARRSWLLSLPQALGGYDLRRGGFPTGLARDSGPVYDRRHYCSQPGMGYTVALVNWKDYALVALPEERAREFVRGNGQREVNLDLEVQVAGAEAGATQTLLLKIVRVRIRDAATGGELADTGYR
jgi:hypothetical protein